MKKIKIICEECCNKKWVCFWEIEEHNFCSHKCYSIWCSKNRKGKNNPMFGKHHNEKTIKSLSGKNNPWFGKHHNNKIRKKIGDKFKGKNNPSYINGKSNFPYPLEFNDRLREQIRKRDNYKCQLCNHLEIERKRLLDVHHIDYNPRNCCSKNLIALCNRCNAKVNFKRNYYKKYFRKKFVKELCRVL